MKRFIFFLGFLFELNNLSSQVNDSDLFNNFNFIIHLVKNGLMEEAEIEKDQFFLRKDLGQLYKDSVNFLLASAYQSYQNKKLSSQRYLEVSNESFLYFPSRYESAIIEAEQGNVQKCLEVIYSIDSSNNTDLNELKVFEVAGAQLLNKNDRGFDSIVQVTSFSNQLLQEEMKKLESCAKVQKKIKRKSAFTAGALSALVPGLGKVYVGNNGQALATFLTVGVMGGIATENYFRMGIDHPQTLFFAGMFSLFYIGNIWGSAVSVQLVKTEKELENKHNILVGIKLPISKFFH